MFSSHSIASGFPGLLPSRSTPPKSQQTPQFGMRPSRATTISAGTASALGLAAAARAILKVLKENEAMKQFAMDYNKATTLDAKLDVLRDNRGHDLHAIRLLALRQFVELDGIAPKAKLDWANEMKDDPSKAVRKYANQVIVDLEAKQNA